MSIPNPWGAYIAGNANNTSTRLFDLTGNGRHATISGTGYSTGTSSGNGAAASIPYIGGTTATKITWPAGSIPTTFTMCSITRVTTSSEKTLLMGYGVGVGTDIYFVHGHWFTPARCSGVAYYGNGWRTQPSSAATSAASYQNWLVMCGSNGTNATPNNILANGVGVGTANGGTSADGTLRINGSPGYESNFQFQQLYIWNVALTNAQLATVSSDMMNYLSTGVITNLFKVGTAPTITSITNGASSFNVFFTAGTGGSPAPTTYQYSLNGGSTYTNANTTNSPIVISSGISPGVSYQIALIATNTSGNTVASNIVTAVISTIGTAPTITSITTSTSSFSVFFTAGTGGSPAPTTYQYSLNGGSTYTNANTTTSPIVISSGVSQGVTYQIALIATNAAGNTAASNIVAATIPKIGTAPTITSITVGTSSFSVFFTAGTGGTPAPTTYQYSLNGGSTYTNANTTTSPIVISIGISPEVAYQVTLIATNAAGNTAASNMVVANIAAPCFLEGSKILRLNLETDQEEYVAVETLREGDLIKTSRNGYKAVFHIGRKTLPNPANDPDKRNRLYRFPKSMSKNMIADLCITGEHCVLYKDLSPILKSRVHKHMGDIYITEYQYRVPACLDERATAYTGTKAVTIWHFALESDNIYYNYGVYANGLLVESCSIQYLTELSNMELV